jgi:steroid Delta-isomerase
MPSAEQITETVNRYLELVAKGQADAVVDLFADDATLEDPVGGEVHIGRQAIRGFYTSIENISPQTELLTLRVCGNEAAFLFAMTIEAGDTSMRIEPIEIQVFNDEGKISSMKAYWGPENVVQS